jgi:hypothetical protein
MPLTFLSASSFDAVRAALDLSLDAGSLPDDLIQSDLYAPTAEAELLERDPLASTYAEGTDKKRRATNAAILLTAAYLAPSLPSIAEEKLGDWQMRQTAPDFTKLAASLRGRAAREINMNVYGTSTRPLQAFWLASGRRGA